RLWFGSMEGDLILWSLNGVRRFGRQDGLGGYRSTAVAEDRTGNLWVGRGGSGLYRIRRTELATVSKADGMTSEDVTSVAEDADGSVLLGTFGGGIVRFQHGQCDNLSMGEDGPR